MPNNILDSKNNHLLSADNIEEIFCQAETNAISMEEAIKRVQLHLESVEGLINKAEDKFANSKIGKGPLFNYIKLKPVELKELLERENKPTTKLKPKHSD